MMVGQGYTVKAAVIEMNMVAEGMTGSKGIYEMNKRLNVDMPIAESVYRVLHERMSPILEMRLLSDVLK
jgi:glycerol-3-phosphate dehydrogenase (NAD(P)+)